MSQALVANVADWKVIGDASNFTVIAITDEGHIVYWKEGKWNEL